MASSYIPTKLADLDVWAANFASQCSTSGSAHGLSAGQVTAVVNAQDAFHMAFVASTTPSTRTPMTVQATQDAKNAMLPLVQQAAMILQNNATMTNELRASYGITVPKSTRTPVPVPTAIPDLSIQQIASGLIVLRAKTLGSVGSAKPFGSTNVRIYRKTGATPPTDISDAAFIGVLTKRFFNDDVSGLAPGTQVWYIAAFATTTGKIGPSSSAITANISA